MYIRKWISVFVVIVAVVITQSCQTKQNEMTELNKQMLANEAFEIVSKVFEYSNNFDFESGLNHYSADVASFYVSDGVPHRLDDLKKAYKQAGAMVEVLENTINKWDAQVLSEDLISFTLQVSLQLKFKGLKEYTGNIVWTGLLQKQGNDWVIIQSHESWQNCAEMASVLSTKEE